MAEGRGEIAGYEFGTRSVARSALGIEDLELLKQTVLFGEEDEEHLRMGSRTRSRTCSTCGTALSGTIST
jgi:hypothetical protein